MEFSQKMQRGFWDFKPPRVDFQKFHTYEEDANSRGGYFGSKEKKRKTKEKREKERELLHLFQRKLILFLLFSFCLFFFLPERVGDFLLSFWV